jgi:hypothetical protein
MQEITWQDRGRMTLCSKGWPEFPLIEPVPGLYRLVLDSGWVYIGEAKNLQYRLADYRTGNTGLIQETRVHAALREAGGAAVSIYTAPHLVEKTSRCMIEADAVRTAREAGLRVLNGAQVTEPYCIQHDIKFHELQLSKLRAKLATIEAKLAAGHEKATTSLPGNL